MALDQAPNFLFEDDGTQRLTRLEFHSIRRVLKSEPGAPSKIYALEGHPEIIARHEDLLAYPDGAKRPEDLLRRAKQLFTEIAELYHIAVPQLSYVSDENHLGSQAPAEDFYIITDRIRGITGRELLQVEQWNHDTAHQILELYEKLVHYFASKAEQAEWFLTDIYPLRQYILGRRQADERETLFLVDLEPHIAEFSQQAFTHGNQRLLASFAALTEQIADLNFKATNFGIPLNYSKLLDRYQLFLDRIPPTPAYSRFYNLLSLWQGLSQLSVRSHKTDTFHT